MKIDSAAQEDSKDPVSAQFERVMKRIIGLPLTVSVENGQIKDVTGNEALLDPHAPGAPIVSTFFSDTALTERFSYCMTTGGEPRLETGAVWPTDAKVEYRKLMVIDLPVNASVKSAKDGLATIVIAPREGAKMTAVVGAEATMGKAEGTVKENLYAGELIWNTTEHRLLSAAYTTGYAVNFDIAKMKGDQRSVRMVKIVRADVPAPK